MCLATSQLFRLARLLIVSLAMLAVSACGIPPTEPGTWDAPDALFRVGPYIVLGTPGTAYVIVQGGGEDSNLEYWIEGDDAPIGDEPPPGSKLITTPMKPKGDLFVATLDGLPIDRRIAYRVRSKKGTTSLERFRVGREPKDSFRFGLFGDTRTGHAVHRAVAEAVSKERIDFLVNTGDLVDRGGVKAQWTQFFELERPLLQKVPIIPAIGNHDWSGRDYFRRYFMLSEWSESRRYYSVDWGNLRILVVDVGIECREGCAQFTFVERALADGANKGMLMVMALHFPPYSSGKHGSHKGIRKPISNLARRYGVELVLTGHDHNYERTKSIDGTTYLVSGSAGAPIRPVSPRRFTAHARTEPHYVLFDVLEDEITLRAINLQGDVFDTAVIQPNPPAKK